MYDEYRQRELDAINKAIADFRAILDTADDEKRDLTPEEDERIAKFDAEIEARQKRVKQWEHLAEAEVRGAEAIRELDIASRNPNAKLSFDARVIQAMREAQDALRGGTQFQEQVIEGVVDLEARARFSFEKRAIADFSDNGALYTTDFATQIAIYQRTLSPWIDLSTILNSNNGRPLNVPKLTADNTTYKPGEGTAITESTPTIGSAALTTSAYKGLSYVSAEAEEDELIGLLPVIARQQARSIGLSFGSDATTSILAAINNGGTALGQGGTGTSTAPFFGWEDLISLYMGRAMPYRRTGVFVAGNAAIQKIMKFRDGQGNYFYSAATIPGAPPTLLNQPLYEDPNLAAPASATKSVVFGDASAALLIKQMPIRVAVSTDFKFDTDQIAVKSVYRAGLAVPDPAAMAYLVSANA